MKLVYCIPDLFRPGGIERMLSVKASYLAEYKEGKPYDVTIITTGQMGKPNYYTFSDKIKFIDLGINYEECLSMPFFKRFLSRRKKRNEHKKKLANVLEQISADIVISTFTHESSFLPSIKDGSKKILEFHFSQGYKQKQAKAEGASFLLKLAYTYLTFIEEHITAPKYDAFIVLTEADRKKWKKTVPNVLSIPNIIPFQNEGQAKLDNPIALSVGRLDAQKGHDRLINIWKIIKDECPDWKLLIIGSGKEKKTLLEQIKSNNLQEQVMIQAPDRNIIQRYSASSLYLMTSRYEGFPMVLLEAMSMGLPCISYTYPNGPAEIIHNGEDGFLVKDGDEALFALQAIKLMKDSALRKEMGTKAQINIRRYACDTIMKQWIRLFDDILVKRS